MSPKPSGGGLVLGDYLLIREIGRGGMGIVYEAYDQKLNRPAAVKVLTLHANHDPRTAARFHHEARIVARLNHPNIVTVYGSGEHNGTQYIAFRLVQGRSLDQFVARHELIDQAAESGAKGLSSPSLPSTEEPSGPGDKGKQGSSSEGAALHWRWIADIGRQAAEALQHAHEMAVIHRDVKPSNLIVEENGQLWVTDFGLAHVSDMSHLTAAGDLLGTLRYMSPEQATGQRGVVDRRTDVYSLGITLYELATGGPAFSTGERASLLKEILFELPKPIRKVVPKIPRDLATIIGKSVAKLPSERYATAKEMADDLRRFLNGVPIVARPPTLMDWARYYALRHKEAVVATLLLAFLSLTAWIFVSQHHARVLQDQVNLLTESREEGIKRERRALILSAQQRRAALVPGRRQDSLASLKRAVESARDVPLDQFERTQLRDEWIAALAIPLDLVQHSKIEFENPIWTTLIDPDFTKIVRGKHDSAFINVFHLGPNGIDNGGRSTFNVMQSPISYWMSPGGRFVTVIKGGVGGFIAGLEHWNIDSNEKVASFDSSLVRIFAWSDDGLRMALLTTSGTVVIQDVTTGKINSTWNAPAGSYDLSWRKGTDELLVSVPSKLCRCDSATGTVLEEQNLGFNLLDSEPHPNRNLVFGMNGGHLIHSWNLSQQRLQQVTTELAIRYVISTDGRLVGTETVSGATTLWDALSGERRMSLMGRPVVFDRSGTRFASCNSLSMTTWDVVHSDVFSSHQLRAHVQSVVSDVCFTADSRWMAVASDNGIGLIELATGREVSVLEPGTRSIHFVEQDGGTRLFSTRAGSTILEREFDPASGTFGPASEVCAAEGVSGTGSGISSFTPDGRWIGLVDGVGRPTVIDRHHWTLRRGSPHVNATTTSISPDGRWLVCGTFHGRAIRIWDLSVEDVAAGERELWDAQPHSRPAFSPDGHWLVVAATNETRVWDTRTWQVVFRQQRIDASDIAAPVAFSPDSRLMAVSNDQINMQLIDTKSWKIVASLQNPESAYAGDIRFSPSGHLLARFTEGRVQLWDLARIRSQLKAVNLDW